MRRHRTAIALLVTVLVGCGSSQQQVDRRPSSAPAAQPSPAAQPPPAVPPSPAAQPAPAGSASSRRGHGPLPPIARVYLDPGHDVHAVTADSEDVRLTFDGHYRDVRLSPDRRTVGVLTRDSVDTGSGGMVEVSNELRLIRGGAFFQRFEPGGFIRGWTFVRNGTAVAVATGGLHFAGLYILYDTATGAELEDASDPVTSSSPDWVRALSP